MAEFYMYLDNEYARPVTKDAFPLFVHLETLDIPTDNDGVRVPSRMDERDLLLQIRQFVQQGDELALRRREQGDFGFAFRFLFYFERVCWGLWLGCCRQGEDGVFDDVDDGTLNILFELTKGVDELVAAGFVRFQQLDASSRGASREREPNQGKRKESGNQDRQKHVEKL
jgi:hypothetical protein